MPAGEQGFPVLSYRCIIILSLLTFQLRMCKFGVKSILWSKIGVRIVPPMLICASCLRENQHYAEINNDWLEMTMMVNNDADGPVR